MAQTDLYNAKNEKVGSLELPGGLFGGRVSAGLLHEVATVTGANERAGTRAHKTRGAVSGGGRKPWKQKGTGRARQGSTRSPQWRHGGTVFGPLPKDYDVRLPQTKRRAALRAALAWKLRDGLVHVSQLSDRFIKDPSEVVKVGQKIQVKVLEVDLVRQRISMTARMSEGPKQGASGAGHKNDGRGAGPRGPGGKPGSGPQRPAGKPASEGFKNNPFAALAGKIDTQRK